MDVDEDDNVSSPHVQDRVQLDLLNASTAATSVQQSQLEALQSPVDPPIFNIPRHNIEFRGTFFCHAYIEYRTKTCC